MVRLIMEEASSLKLKLENLKKLMPGQDTALYDFAIFLAAHPDFNGRQMIPLGFSNVATLAIYELEKGFDNVTGERIDNFLSKQHDYFYRHLESLISEIAKAVCSENFAKEVEDLLERSESATERVI